MVQNQENCAASQEQQTKTLTNDEGDVAQPLHTVPTSTVRVPPSISVTNNNYNNFSRNNSFAGKQNNNSIADLNRNLLPFELTRNMNTEWLMNTDARHRGKLTPLLITYITSILLGQTCNAIFFPAHISWTITNVIHGFITMMYLHWIKGSPNFYDVSGSGAMSGMTLWEQLYYPPSIAENNNRFAESKLVLLVVPTLLCYAGCAFSSYDRACCMINVVVWCICILAKMPFMHGVRILGINRTVGIDDLPPTGVGVQSSICKKKGD